MPGIALNRFKTRDEGFALISESRCALSNVRRNSLEREVTKS